MCVIVTFSLSEKTISKFNVLYENLDGCMSPVVLCPVLLLNCIYVYFLKLKITCHKREIIIFCCHFSSSFFFFQFLKTGSNRFILEWY